MRCFCRNLISKGKILFKKLRNSKLPILEQNKQKTIFRGSVMIEFAVCVPVLIFLVFYTNDLFTIYRYHLKLEIVAQQIINMIQRSTYDTNNRTLNTTTLKNIFCASFLTIYPGTTMFNNSESDTPSFAFGHHPFMSIYLVETTATDVASCKWRYYVGSDSAKTPSNLTVSEKYTNDFAGSYVRYETNVTPSTILSSLNMPYIAHAADDVHNDNVKIIIETSLKRHSSSAEWKSLLHMFWINPKLRPNDKDYAFQVQQSFCPNFKAFDKNNGIPTAN